MVALMLRTGIPVSVWESEAPAVTNTALAMLTQGGGDGAP